MRALYLLTVPSPLGHALAGATIAWVAQSVRRTPLDPRASNRLALVCAGVAVSPDLDFIYAPVHRMASHSITAVVLVTAIAGLVAWRRRAAWPVVILCGLAYGSHLVLDWLGNDTKVPRGIQLLWPFSDAWFISSWGLFGATTLGGSKFFTPETLLSNAMTILGELLKFAPVAAIAWAVQRRAILKK